MPQERFKRERKHEEQKYFLKEVTRNERWVEFGEKDQQTTHSSKHRFSIRPHTRCPPKKSTTFHPLNIPQLPLSKGGLHTTVLPSVPSPGNGLFTRSGKTLYRARTIIPFLSPPSVTLHDHWLQHSPHCRCDTL